MCDVTMIEDYHVVKVQLSLAPTPATSMLVYNEDRSLEFQGPCPKEIKEDFGTDVKRFYLARLDPETRHMDLIKEVEVRDW